MFAVARSIIYFFPIVPIIVVDALFIVIVFFAIGYLMYQAIKNKKPSVHYVTAGAITATVFILIDRLFATSVIPLSTEAFYVVLALSFICFPIGLTPLQYLQEIRFNHARQLLEQRKVSSVKAAAAAIGIQRTEYFSALFKERFGKSPSEYLA